MPICIEQASKRIFKSHLFKALCIGFNHSKHNQTIILLKICEFLKIICLKKKNISSFIQFFPLNETFQHIQVNTDPHREPLYYFLLKKYLKCFPECLHNSNWQALFSNILSTLTNGQIQSKKHCLSLLLNIIKLGNHEMLLFFIERRIIYILEILFQWDEEQILVKLFKIVETLFDRFQNTEMQQEFFQLIVQSNFQELFQRFSFYPNDTIQGGSFLALELISKNSSDQ